MHRWRQGSFWHRYIAHDVLARCVSVWGCTLGDGGGGRNWRGENYAGNGVVKDAVW